MSAIVTERFILRPQVITDYDVWYPMYSDPKIFHLVNAPGFTPEEAWNRLLRNIGHWSIFGYGIRKMYLDIAGSAGAVKQSPRINGESCWRKCFRDYSGQHNKDDYKTTDFPFILFGAHNVYYVKLNL